MSAEERLTQLITDYFAAELNWSPEAIDDFAKSLASRLVGEVIPRTDFDELLDAAEAVLRGGEHDGPCLNWDGQDAADYDQFDSCYLHLEVAAGRKEVLRRAVAVYREVETQ